ncbi:MAG: hypothetical protein ACFB10_07345 [Salibacteraceae bacterium]
MFKNWKWLPFLLLLVSFSLSQNVKSQIVLENKTNCDYIVKVNTIPTVPVLHCFVNGMGPAYYVPASVTLTVPGPSSGLWTPAFGCEEALPRVLSRHIVGEPLPLCGTYPQVFGPYGSCLATFEYINQNHLLIRP